MCLQKKKNKSADQAKRMFQLMCRCLSVFVLDKFSRDTAHLNRMALKKKTTGLDNAALLRFPRHYKM